MTTQNPQSPRFATADEAPDSDLSLRSLFVTAWRGRWILLVCVGLGVVTGFRKIEEQGEIWRAQSRVFVHGKSRNPAFYEGFIGSGTYEFLGTQAAVLRSTSLLQAVAARPEVASSKILSASSNKIAALRSGLSIDVGRDDDILTVSLVYALGWLISMGMAGGVLIHALTGIEYRTGMSVIVSICVLYTLLGGLRAVIGTDFVQTVVILVGISVLAWLAIDRVGVDAMHAAASRERPELLNLLFPAALMFLFNNLLFGIGEVFHSNVWWSRAFAFRQGVGMPAYLLAGALWLPVPIVAGFIALTVPAIGVNVPSADMVGPIVAAHLLGTGGAIAVFIVVFAALASSLDSLLAATSDLVLTDLYKGHFRPDASPEQLARAARYVVLGLGLLTWLLCLPRLATLAELLHLTGAFVASTIWPIAAGLYWRRASPAAASAAMVAGTVCGLIGYATIGFYVAALISAAVSMVIVWVGARVRPDDFQWERLAEEAPS